MENRFYVRLSTLILRFVWDPALVAAIVNYFDINIVYHIGVSSLLSIDKALVFLQPWDNVSGKPQPPTFLHMSSGSKMFMVTLVPWTPCVDNTLLFPVSAPEIPNVFWYQQSKILSIDKATVSN